MTRRITRDVSTGRIESPGDHPALRFGLGLRRGHFEAILAGADLAGVDFLELVPENFIGFGGIRQATLDHLVGSIPMVTHGICLSLGSPDPLDEEYLGDLQAFLDAVRPEWHSDHLCLSSYRGVEYHDLLPVPLDVGMLDRMAGRIQEVVRRTGRTFLIENPTGYLDLPGSTMSVPEFLEALCERTGCGILLDINNLWVNALNGGPDPLDIIDAIPAGRVFQYHLAGHRPGEPLVIDSHGSEVAEEVLDLYLYALRRIGPAWTLLERDQDLPALDDLIGELDRLRRASTEALRRDRLDISLPVTPRGEGSGDAITEDPLELQHRVVIGDLSPEEGSRRLGCSVAGLRYHRNTFRRHHREILGTLFPGLFSLLDEDAREDIVAAYQRDHPLGFREINENAAAFPGWLADRIAARELSLGEFHAELALVEWTLFECGKSRISRSEGWSSRGLVLNPVLNILQLSHDVARFLEDRSDFEELPTPQILLIVRDPGSHRPRILRGTPSILLVLKVFTQRVPEASLSELGVDSSQFEQALEEAREAKLVLPDPAEAA